MTEERFYCERSRCSVHNKKTGKLSDYLEFFKNAEFVFGDEFTPEVLFEQLRSEVVELNSKYKGREIEVTMMRFGGTISYNFKDNPYNDASLGSMSLHPIATTIDNINKFKVE